MGEDYTDPLRPQSFLVGLVSFGPRICGTPGFPGVYTVILTSQFGILTRTFIFMRLYSHLSESRSVHRLDFEPHEEKSLM